MIRKIMSDIDVKAGLAIVLNRVEEACANRGPEIKAPKPRLVAVSKTKPAQMIIDAYSAGQRHFGENYVNELEEKGSNEEILKLCPEIRWHFIGHLQRNKINKVLKVPNMYMIETVDSEKLANSLNSAWERAENSDKQPLKVMVQVNTSGEEEKNGVEPKEAFGLFKHIRDNLPHLQVEGVMTIGRFDHSYADGPNPDFIALMGCHKEICEKLSLQPEEVHVSMGMSNDFYEAITMGSTNVRVGSSIFGYRAKKTASS